MIEVTLIVRSDNHFDETVITKTLENGNGNPRYDGSNTATLVVELLDHVVVQLDRLVDSPLSDQSVNTVTMVRQSYLEKLRAAQDLLEVLQNAGVDNWEGYDQAVAELEQRVVR